MKEIGQNMPIYLHTTAERKAEAVLAAMLYVSLVHFKATKADSEMLLADY